MTASCTIRKQERRYEGLQTVLNNMLANNGLVRGLALLCCLILLPSFTLAGAPANDSFEIENYQIQPEDVLSVFV